MLAAPPSCRIKVSGMRTMVVSGPIRTEQGDNRSGRDGQPELTSGRLIHNRGSSSSDQSRILHERITLVAHFDGHRRGLTRKVTDWITRAWHLLPASIPDAVKRDVRT